MTVYEAHTGQRPYPRTPPVRCVGLDRALPCTLLKSTLIYHLYQAHSVYVLREQDSPTAASPWGEASAVRRTRETYNLNELDNLDLFTPKPLRRRGVFYLSEQSERGPTGPCPLPKRSDG